MAKYIPAEKLIAEIEKRLSMFEHGIAYDCWAACKKIVESLQQEQPEVDLENEYKRFINCPNGRSMYECARHFAEWGAIHLNARKEE